VRIECERVFFCTPDEYEYPSRDFCINLWCQVGRWLWLHGFMESVIVEMLSWLLLAMELVVVIFFRKVLTRGSR
jgi:hypothetical protein